jgi:5-methylcytosine-specific restriction endonuclease McrA
MHVRRCDHCGEMYRGTGRQFCSISCRTTWRNLRANPAKTPEARQKISQARVGKPTTAGRRLPQKQRRKIAKSLRGRQLTPEHRQAIGKGVKRAGNKPPRNEHLVGPRHPNWKGGHSPLRNSDRHKPEYIYFRQTCLERDNWTCQDCRVRGGLLHVHHIKPWGPYPDLRYDPANGATLCRPCHYSRHRGQPRPLTVGPRTPAERESNPAAAS